MAEPGYEVLKQHELPIKRFTDAMRYKLKVNAKKGRWEDLTPEKALALLKREVEELEEAIKHGNIVEVMLEGADVANFAMMIADIVATRDANKGGLVSAPENSQ